MNLNFSNLNYLEAILTGVDHLKALINQGFLEENDEPIRLLYGSMSENSHFLQFVLGDEATDKYCDLDLGIINDAQSLEFAEAVGKCLAKLLDLDLVQF